MINKEELITLVEQNLAGLKECFLTNINDYFFTEKELHSHFYHLCISNYAFHHKGYSLLHTEYPSPFKCSYLDNEPYIQLEPIDAKKQRSHIDCVLINPLFIDWLVEHGHGTKALIGIGNNRFDLYIKDFYTIYHQFNQETNEAILLYALEFKFLRHSYSGSKYPIKEIKQDIAKLKLLSDFSNNLHAKIEFVEKTKLMIFIGERAQRVRDRAQASIRNYDTKQYDISVRKP
jgi:hypothetical protein